MPPGAPAVALGLIPVVWGSILPSCPLFPLLARSCRAVGAEPLLCLAEVTNNHSRICLTLN